MNKLAKKLVISTTFGVTMGVPLFSIISCANKDAEITVSLQNGDANFIKMTNNNGKKGKDFETVLSSENFSQYKIEISKVTINGEDASDKYQFEVNTKTFRILGKYVTGNVVIEPKIIYSVPTVDIKGILPTKDGEENTLQLSYDDYVDQHFESNVKIKIQGNYSINYPKKNYNIKLVDKQTGNNYKVKLQPNWKKDHKYTLKANYADALSMHNIVACQVWGDIIHQKKYISELDGLLNGGAIDGFPIKCYNNGEFLGLYTWNLKKHGDLFNMKEGKDKKHALLLGNWTLDPNKEYLYFKKQMTELGQGWQLEFSSTGEKVEDTKWILDSFNKFIDFVKSVDNPTDFKNGIYKYTNLQLLIDYYIFIKFAADWDNTGNNFMWATFDGDHWYPTIYDSEFCFGFQGQNFNTLFPVDVNIDNKRKKDEYIAEHSVLLDKLREYCQDEIKTEYESLKQVSLSYPNIIKKFDVLWKKITPELYGQDITKWPEVTNRRVAINTLENAKQWLKERYSYCPNKIIEGESYGKD